MGRHARGAVRAQVVARIAGIAVPAVLIVAAGWFWVAGASGAVTLDPTSTGTAVVVSSLPCQNGDEGTVVDVQDPVGQPAGTTRRATLDACGHRPGDVVAVEYSTADPGRVVPAAVTAGSDDATGRLLPLGLMLAALLGVAAVAAVVRDARRPRPAGTAPAGSGGGTGRGRHARPDEDEPAPIAAAPVPEPTAAVRGSDLDLLFPPAERLRDSLHDELFTHRSAAGV